MAQDLSAIGWPLVTDRLTLRPATPDDAADLFAIRRLPEVYEWLNTAPASLAAFRTAVRDPDRLARTIVVTHDERTIGDVMLRLEDAWAQDEVLDQAVSRQAEIGWVLDPACQGRGFATEAVTAVVDAAFSRLDVHRIVAHCFADNEPSWRLMERIGMRRETYARRDSLHRDRGWLDGMSYGLLAEEWASRHDVGPGPGGPAGADLGATGR